jgi:metallophosphoesterase (TIGR00282 family)
MSAKNLRVLAIGDVIGRPGRKALSLLLPKAKETFAPDLIIANGENAAGGFGLTKKIFDEMTGELGIDVITMGNHWADKREIYNFAFSTPQVVLPGNMYNVEHKNKGHYIGKSKSGIPYLVSNLTGRVFMKGDNTCPFNEIDSILALPEIPAIRIVDIHAEATSEKQALGHYLTNRASLVYGTHTHCPTADERILGSFTGFATDLGMTGGYDSVVGMDKKAAISNLMAKEKKPFEPAKNDLWLCAVFAEISPETGACLSIERIRWSA